MRQHIVNILKLLLVAGIGFGIFRVMTGNPKTAEHLPDSLDTKPVRTLVVAKKPFVVQVRAYGNVEPAREFQSRAELSAKVSYVHPELKQGGSIEAGTVVVRLEAEDFEISLSQTKSDLSSRRSELERLRQEERNTRATLELVRKNLELGEIELQRVRSLLEKQLIARSTLDAEEQKVLQLRQNVTDLEGRLSTYSSQLAGAGAQVSRSSQQVESQKTTLGRTEIVMPFDARINSVGVTEGEFVSVGTGLFVASNIDTVEVRADLPMTKMRELLSAFAGQTFDFAENNISSVLRSLNISAEVRLVEAGVDALWQGRVVRVSDAIDQQKRTIGLTIAVNDPVANVVVGSKPPLIKGMYVAVDLSAPPFEAISIPRSAVHQGRVYLVNEVGELEIRPVRIRAKQGARVVVANGIGVGDRVVIDDLIPVIEGMPLRAIDIETSAAVER